jgi:hypothetical protein
MAGNCNAMLNPGFTVVFDNHPKHVCAMSLNRSEQMLYDYVQGQGEERQYWQDKVRRIVAESPEIPAAVARIDSELWRYFEERSSVVPVFVADARAFGMKRTSMKNLSELLVRLWTEPKRRSPLSANSQSRPD